MLGPRGLRSDYCLAVQRLHHFESTAPDMVAFVQPMGAEHGGLPQEITWGEALDQRRRPMGA